MGLQDFTDWIDTCGYDEYPTSYDAGYLEIMRPALPFIPNARMSMINRVLILSPAIPLGTARSTMEYFPEIGWNPNGPCVTFRVLSHGETVHEVRYPTVPNAVSGMGGVGVPMLLDKLEHYLNNYQHADVLKDRPAVTSGSLKGLSAPEWMSDSIIWTDVDESAMVYPNYDIAAREAAIVRARAHSRALDRKAW